MKVQTGMRKRTITTDKVKRKVISPKILWTLQLVNKTWLPDVIIAAEGQDFKCASYILV